MYVSLFLSHYQTFFCVAAAAVNKEVMYIWVIKRATSHISVDVETGETTKLRIQYEHVVVQLMPTSVQSSYGVDTSQAKAYANDRSQTALLLSLSATTLSVSYPKLRRQKAVYVHTHTPTTSMLLTAVRGALVLSTAASMWPISDEHARERTRAPADSANVISPSFLS